MSDRRIRTCFVVSGGAYPCSSRALFSYWSWSDIARGILNGFFGSYINYYYDVYKGMGGFSDHKKHITNLLILMEYPDLSLKNLTIIANLMLLSLIQGYKDRLKSI